MFDLLRFANSPKNVNLVLKWAPIISWILVAVTVGYTIGFPLFLSITENGGLFLRIISMNATGLRGVWAAAPDIALRLRCVLHDAPGVEKVRHNVVG